MTAKVIVLLLIVTLFVSGTLLTVQATQSSPSFNFKRLSSTAQELIDQLTPSTPTSTQIISNPTPNTITPTAQPTTGFNQVMRTPTSTPTSIPTATPTPYAAIQTQPTKPPCLSQFAIPDRPTYCYSPNDFTQIRAHYYDYTSAKSFYEFHLRGVEQYQQEYEQTGSDVYLDAKASSQQKADQEKAKMDAAYAAMLTIEPRGFPIP